MVTVAGPATRISSAQFVGLINAQAHVVETLGKSSVLQTLPSAWLCAIQEHRKANIVVYAGAGQRSDSNEASPRRGSGSGSDDRSDASTASVDFASEVTMMDVKSAVGRELVSLCASQVEVPFGSSGMYRLVPVRWSYVGSMMRRHVNDSWASLLRSATGFGLVSGGQQWAQTWLWLL